MKKVQQFSDVFKIIPISSVKSVIGNNYTTYTPSNEMELHSNNDISISQTPNRNDSGVSYSISTTIIIPKNEQLMLFNKFPVLIILKTLATTQKIWGSKEFPVRATITPTPDADTMSISLKSVSITPIV